MDNVITQTDSKFEWRYHQLYRHFVRAMTLFYYQQKLLEKEESFESYPGISFIDESFDHTILMQASLAVVIEGYRKLKLKNETIDALLEDKDACDALRQLRNSVYHYQMNPHHKRIVTFTKDTHLSGWTWNLRTAFEKMFEEKPPKIASIELLSVKF